MSKSKNLIGKRFNKLLVIKKLENSKDGHIQYLCQCDCGNQQKVYATHLINNRRTMCKKCSTLNINKIHGFTNTKAYNIWQQIKQRCYNPNNKSYKNYGGRGITVCDEWLNNPTIFCEWYIKNNPNNLSIDRIDVNGNYCPENCRFITIDEQANNKTNTVYISKNGVVKTNAQWAKEVGISVGAMWHRNKRHKDDARIFEKQWKDNKWKNQYTDMI